MKQTTKQRIVGTIVLLALALIFLPIVFDGQGSYQGPLASRIPEAPVVPVLPEPEPTRPVIIADTPVPAEPSEQETAPAEPPGQAPASIAAPQQESAPQGAEVVTSQPVFSREVPALGDDGLPQGWSVRLGSFSDVDNAANLMQRLQAAGYKAYTRQISSQQRELTAVFVGPWLERSRVDDYQRQLQEQFQLAGIVVPFELERLP